VPEEQVELRVQRLAAAVVVQGEPLQDGKLIPQDELVPMLRPDVDELLALAEAPQVLQPDAPGEVLRGQLVGAADPAGADVVVRTVVQRQHAFSLQQLQLADSVVAEEAHQLVQQLGVVVDVEHDLVQPAELDERPGQHGRPADPVVRADAEDVAEDLPGGFHVAGGGVAVQFDAAGVEPGQVRRILHRGVPRVRPQRVGLRVLLAQAVVADPQHPADVEEVGNRMVVVDVLVVPDPPP